MKIAMLVLAAAACSGAGSERAAMPAPSTATPAASAVERPVAKAGEPSVYELELMLRDADSAAVPLDVHRGHPTLISMFYGSCATACPALIGYAKQIVAQTGPDTRVLLVSFDAARDTPARLSGLRDAHRLDEQWTLAAADDVDARALAAVLGIKYRASTGGEFFHNSVILALDEEGRPITRMNGLGDSSELVAALGRR